MVSGKQSGNSKLKHVVDSSTGITRKHVGKKFAYFYHGKKINNKSILVRIQKLAIPPAWVNIWICADANGHLQATGLDKLGRKQYKYHTRWNEKRNETKFHRLLDFGKTLPILRKKVHGDISKSSLCKEKVLATIVSLMERTYIRVGNYEYEKFYGSYGLTTLKDNHVKISGSSIKFSFNGKKGIHHNITLKNRRLANIVRSCRDIPGKELFQYVNEKGSHAVIDSGMVNDYIKETSDIDFTAKDFRTWAGTLTILNALKSKTETPADDDIKHNILSALDEVSLKLGNTRTVCRKYYVHPQIIKLYEDGGLQPYLRQLKDIETNSIHTKLTTNEKVLMKILKKFD